MDLEAHNRPFLRQRGRLRLYAGFDATVAVRAGEQYHQVCQVGFSGDGSIRLQWPYLRVGEGIVAAAHVPDGMIGSTTITLHEQGKFTSQLVKLSHHTSGEAAFSQTGKVRTEVRRQSFPLTGPIGRIFELHVFYPDKFKPLERLKRGRIYLGFDFGDAMPNAVIVRGEWRRKESISENTAGRGDVGPLTQWADRRTRAVEPVAFFAPPLNGPLQTHLLCVTSAVIPLPTGAREPGIILMAGLDYHEVPPERAGEPLVLKDLLIAMYPTHSSEEFRRRVGTIDLSVDPAV